MEVELKPPEPGETPPVLLENNRLVAPYEEVTKLFSLPHPTEMDPTPILAFFFFIFFGLCLADVGYGLILALGTYWAHKRLPLSAEAHRMMQFLFLNGIAAVLGGIITGDGWGT